MTTYNVLIQTCNQQNLLKNNTILFFETITPTPRGTKNRMEAGIWLQCRINFRTVFPVCLEIHAFRVII